jgi:hypothetical protein
MDHTSGSTCSDFTISFINIAAAEDGTTQLNCTKRSILGVCVAISIPFSGSGIFAAGRNPKVSPAVRD